MTDKEHIADILRALDLYVQTADITDVYLALQMLAVDREKYKAASCLSLLINDLLDQSERVENG